MKLKANQAGEFYRDLKKKQKGKETPCWLNLFLSFLDRGSCKTLSKPVQMRTQD